MVKANPLKWLRKIFQPAERLLGKICRSGQELPVSNGLAGDRKGKDFR